VDQSSTTHSPGLSKGRRRIPSSNITDHSIEGYEHLLFMTSGASPFTPTFPNYSLKNQTATKNTKTPHRKKKKINMEKKWVDISPPAC
jgi:hypothetical protein